MEVKFKNFRNRHIMLELPTIKTDFSSRTHRISIRLHMQDHNIPLSLSIISVYILTVFCEICFQKVTSRSCHVFFCSTTQALKFSTWFSTHFEIFDMVFNTVFNMVHTIGEFLCLKCVENILKKHFENFRMF